MRATEFKHKHSDYNESHWKDHTDKKIRQKVRKARPCEVISSSTATIHTSSGDMFIVEEVK